MARMTVPATPEMDIDLFGEVYDVRRPTKSLHAELDALPDEDPADLADPVAYIKLVGRGLNVRLAKTAPKQPDPTDVLLRAWENDEMTIPELDAIVDYLNEAHRPPAPVSARPY